jgi:hypothetical protein
MFQNYFSASEAVHEDCEICPVETTYFSDIQPGARLPPGIRENILWVRKIIYILFHDKQIN